ncbi:MAG: SDR family oxidoreductase [Elusimicrobia bacterium]|nr:SDR family oxidoreductase [Elusimicrobiota bacterium]
MKILIIGVPGQVGVALIDACAKVGIDCLGAGLETDGARFAKADITDPLSLNAVFRNFAPDVSILCASLTGVDYCEAFPEQARKINVSGTENFARSCDKYKSKPVFISSEYVFDGKTGPYRETDEPNPLNVYGKTKLEGEKIISAFEKFLIIRTTVVYSYMPGSANFLMQVIGPKPPQNVANDQYSNPTYAPDLAEGIIKLIIACKSGVFNIVGKDRLNRYDFALKICKVFGLDPSAIKPKPTSELNQKAARPLSAGLLTDKLKAETGYIMPDVNEGLRRALELSRK